MPVFGEGRGIGRASRSLKLNGVRLFRLYADLIRRRGEEVVGSSTFVPIWRAFNQQRGINPPPATSKSFFLINRPKT